VSGLILPNSAQQQPTQLGFQIVDNGNGLFVLVIQSPPAQFMPMPPGPIEQIEAFCNTILGACAQSRKQTALLQEVAQGNGTPARVVQ